MLIYLTMCGSNADSSKFELLYKNYKASMFKIANAILKNVDLAEDAVQQSFMKIIKNLHKIDDVFSNKTRALIVIIVKNTSIDIYRRRKKNYAVSLEELATEPIDTNMAPPEFVISEESAELMKSNISKLPQKYSDGRILSKTAAVFIIATWFLVAKVEAVRVPVMNFYLDIKDEFTRIVIQDEGTESRVRLTNKKELYLPSFIPDSYKPVRVIDNKKENSEERG